MTTLLGSLAFAIAVTVVLVLILVVILFRLTWRVAEPNEALIISGRRHRLAGVEETMGFKIVTGRGTLVTPGVQAVRRLSLDLRETEIQIDCVTQQGIPLKVRGVVIYKVGDDMVSIANSARRFLDQQNQMDQKVHNLFAGHLRAIVGNMTVEEMIRDREKLTQLTREHAGTEMEKLGLIVDSLQVQEIIDPTGYIENIAQPHAWAVAREARIAKAQADRDATQKEQEAEATKALARRDAQIKQQGYQAEIDQASAQAQQAGPLADATARQQVVVEETKVTQLEAQKAEKQLEVQVRKPADAKAYEQVTLAGADRSVHIAQAEARAREVELAAVADAGRVKVSAAAQAESVKLAADAAATQTRMVGQAEADAAQAKGLAEGEAIRAKGMAEAEAIKARAAALADNQDAVIGQELAENWPAIVEAAAKPFGNIDQLIVLNGAEGISEALAQALSQGAAGLQLARSLLG
ncbi:MAG: SPFH domain-containing protein, partial [Candidatus Dormibacteraeota bacterium]|nr:SPFH domain-containing protein [Candidatus Dormibacteraeota bacterium]